MKCKCLLICGILFFSSCNSKINQYEKSGNKNYRTGKWIEKDSVENGLYVIKGKYRHNEKVGVWKTYFNEKLYQKDKIKDSLIKTKFYFPTRKVMERGQSKLIIKENSRHWFYSGDWKYYDKNGRLIYKKTYSLGKKVDSISYK